MFFILKGEALDAYRQLENMDLIPNTEVFEVNIWIIFFLYVIKNILYYFRIIVITFKLILFDPIFNFDHDSTNNQFGNTISNAECTKWPKRSLCEYFSPRSCLDSHSWSIFNLWIRSKSKLFKNNFCSSVWYVTWR